ncbi:MAG TPA: phage minor head protein, partial [Planctomycetaceae bacterium]|nr:phage minor head protein [Planctomycetaceae bacterium]
VQGNAEDSLRPVLQKFLSGQILSAVTVLRSKGDKRAVDGNALAIELLPHVHFDDMLEQKVKPIIQQQIAKGMSLQITSAERSTALHSKVLMQLRPEVTQHMQQALDNTLVRLVDEGHWKDVNDETRRQLSFVLQEGITDGDTLREMADRVEREMGPEWSGPRALKIARTESTAALNAGHYLGQQELEDEGLAFGAEWMSIIDKDTRPDHVAADGQQIGVGETFNVGGFPAKYPGDPDLPAQERVNCRCVAVPITEPPKSAPVNRLKQHMNGHATNGHAVCC